MEYLKRRKERGEVRSLYLTGGGENAKSETRRRGCELRREEWWGSVGEMTANLDFLLKQFYY
jgi:hypothetical protein